MVRTLNNGCASAADVDSLKPSSGSAAANSLTVGMASARMNAAQAPAISSDFLGAAASSRGKTS